MADLQWVLVEGLSVLQTGVNDYDIDVDLGEGLFGGAVGAFVTTLVIGALLLAIAPDYVERLMGALEDRPIDSLVTGIVALVAFIIVIVFLAITILGLLLVVPLGMVAVLVWAAGAVVAYLLIGDRLVGHEDGWAKPLLVGAALNGGLALTGIGGLLSFCIGAAGFGTIVRDWQERRNGR